MVQGDIKTRFLVISDTHGASLFDEADSVRNYDSDNSAGSQRPDQTVINGFRRPLPKADVAIHCGDLTYDSGLKEYEATFNLMHEIDAPLKLVIAGNHDVTLDTAYWERKISWMDNYDRTERAAYPARTYELVERARQAGIHLLDEGTHHFVLRNGARLVVFASPWTPDYGGWAFQYRGPHDFAIPEGIDLVMTHGPPRNILDRTLFGARAGCKHLLDSVSRARPRMHCFGHIHESWGARLVTWKPKTADEDAGPGRRQPPTAPAAMLPPVPRAEQQAPEETLGLDALDVNAADPATRAANLERANTYGRERCVQVNMCAGDGRALEQGRHTLFVNAAIMDIRYKPHQLPWLVDLELPPPDEEHRRKADATAAVLQRDRRLMPR